MSLDAKDLSTEEEKQKSPPADTGNASNPPPHNNFIPADNQLLGEKAETYLRESANIEDIPDPLQEQEAEDQMSKPNES